MLDQFFPAAADQQPRPSTTVNIPDLEVPLPDLDDLLRAAYARAIDDDERGDIRVQALSLCYDMLRGRHDDWADIVGEM